MNISAQETTTMGDLFGKDLPNAVEAVSIIHVRLQSTDGINYVIVEVDNTQIAVVRV